ncbi:hypothetical protein AXF42_Ash003261 [Apostasia shenzhenica]|uniref:Uncharacterized protein n=1 Tax=Apostasia shenzhenica TaxID=1088818 RepID=A0A2I0BFQ8_9ASPA|nr:hypothetical protein AXF42_Ash003261 [Apostasia shenzhenica]
MSVVCPVSRHRQRLLLMKCPCFLVYKDSIVAPIFLAILIFCGVLVVLFSSFESGGLSFYQQGDWPLLILPREIEKIIKDSDAVKDALDKLNQIGWAKKWSSQPYVSRRTTSLRELTTLGLKNAENLAIPSIRNDAAFLFTVVGTTGFLAVLAGQLPGLPGKVFHLRITLTQARLTAEFLIISLIVLPKSASMRKFTNLNAFSISLLQAAISGFSSFFPDYQERIARHEAAHFLVAYLIGLPILNYSLDIGKEHVNLSDERLQKLVYSGKLDDKELDRSKTNLTKVQQQNLTRWAVLLAGSLLKNNKAAHEALVASMSKKFGILDCIKAIENVS